MQNIDENKLVTCREVEAMMASLTNGKGGYVYPETLENGRIITLIPDTEWYGIAVENNQNITLDLSALSMDKRDAPQVYDFYLVLFTHKGSAVKWSSQFTWVGSAGIPSMAAYRGYVYKIQIFLHSESVASNPLAQYVDNECLVAITPEYDFPIVHPPVSGVIITAKYNNDYQDEEGNIHPRETRSIVDFPNRAGIEPPWYPDPDQPGPGDPDPIDGPEPVDPTDPSNPDPIDPTDPIGPDPWPEPAPTRFPPGDEYYLVMDDPQGYYKRPGFKLFIKIAANYIPSNKSVYLVFLTGDGIVSHVVEMNGESLEQEIDTSVGMSPSISYLGYVIGSPNSPPGYITSWTKLGNLTYGNF